MPHSVGRAANDDCRPLRSGRVRSQFLHVGLTVNSRIILSFNPLHYLLVASPRRRGIAILLLAFAADCVKHMPVPPGDCASQSAAQQDARAWPNQYCGSAQRRALAGLIGAAASSTDSTYLSALVAHTDYPDARIADAAALLAADSTAAMPAQVAALRIIARQMYGPEAELVVTSIGMKPMAPEQFLDPHKAHCSVYFVGDRGVSIPTYTSPAPDVVERLREKLSDLVHATPLPIIRNLSRCIIGGA